MIKPQISIIAAIAENYVIGANNSLPWHIPEDLKRFKKLTSGHMVIMGRHTYLSLPVKPLPNRRNVVVTTGASALFDGCETVPSVEDAIRLMDKGKENFVIGGAQIYKHFLPLADRLYLTMVHKEFEGDVFFPSIDLKEWEVVDEERHSQENPMPLDYTFLTLKAAII